MRADGNVLGAGDPNQTSLGLPMGEREDRDVVRARMEAKRERQAAASPWAGRPVAAAPEPPRLSLPAQQQVRAAQFDLVHDRDRERELFESKPLVPAPRARRSRPAAQAQRFATCREDCTTDCGPCKGHGRPSPLAPAPVRPPAARTKPGLAPRPKPAAKTGPPATTARTHPPFDPAGIVQDYVGGMTVKEIAVARHHGVKRVRDLIRSTPGIEYRDDRKTRSGSTRKNYDKAVVDAVRRLYVTEGLTQAQVADRLRLTTMVVQTIMSRYEIPTRADVATSRVNYNRPGRSTIAHLRQQIEAAGLTPGELRTWARANGHDVAAAGLPSAKVLAAYVVANQKAVEVDVVPDMTKFRTAVVEAAAPATPAAVHPQLEAAYAGAQVVVDAMTQVMRDLAAALASALKNTHTKDDYTLGGPS